MKVAFATNDRKTIASQTGRANEFAIYELSDNNIIRVEYFENQHEHEHHHNHEHEHQHDHHHEQGHSHKEITEKLSGVDYLYAKHVGTHFKSDLQNAGIEFLITKEDEIMNVINSILKKI